MKKIWKNLFACSLAIACSGAIAGCGGEEAPVSRDLDGDGQISTWETLYEDMQHTIDKSITGEITFISTADELLDINNHVDEQRIYALKKDIDLGGKEVSIDLGKSQFYGYNFVISNFKLGTINGAAIGTSGYENTFVKSLFRNGTGVFSTRIFMGMQSITVDNAERNSSYYISPMFNVPVVSDIDVKGKIKVSGMGIDNRISAAVNASLLYSGMAMETVLADESTVMVEDVTCIDNVNVDGEIIIDNQRGSRIGVNAGGIASAITKNSFIYNCYAQVKIVSTSAEVESNIAGIVGHNKGFVSTCTYTGDVLVNNDAFMSVLYEGGINIGGIIGTNDKLAEVKNCSTNAKISLSTAETETGTDGSDYFVGGIVGTNESAIIELCQSDAIITLTNLFNVFVGGTAGVSNNGIISYNICRGSITATNVGNITTAQVVGFAKNGLFEKVMTTTGINIDNSGRTTERLKLGMVTVFEDESTSPYFRRVMVDGVSQVFTREIDNSKFDYKQGLRYPYLVQVGMEDEEAVYDIVLPEVFENLYRASSCKLYKYSLVGQVKSEDAVNISYANNMVGTSTGTTRWMIDYMDFKNYLNHNEVSLDANLSLSTLHFTIGDAATRLQSFFGGGKYNGELAYFDREFTTSYNHETNSLGSCQHDANDEMLSFVYDLIKSNNGKSKELYAIKVDSSYINRAPDNTEKVDGLSADANIFVDKLCNVFGCLSTSVSVTRLDAEGNNLEDDETGLAMAKFVEINFSDNNNNYSMKIDISSMQDTATVTEDAESAFMLYVIFTISNKIVG